MILVFFLYFVICDYFVTDYGDMWPRLARVSTLELADGNLCKQLGANIYNRIWQNLLSPLRKQALADGRHFQRRVLTGTCTTA